MKHGQPALMLLCTTYDETGVPYESARELVCADRCRMLVERRVPTSLTASALPAARRHRV